jgi:GH15 family glucan-1,4-alpha-glucosidase
MGGRIDRETARFLTSLGETVCKHWQEPDEGIWEVRGGRRHHTHSKVLCWVALDRLIRLHELGHIKAKVDDFVRERQAIRDLVEEHAYNSTLGSYTSVFDGDEVDMLTTARWGVTRVFSTAMRLTPAFSPWPCMGTSMEAILACVRRLP